MLQDPEFDSKDIDPDLHRRMDKVVQDGSIQCFNMRESEADDGDQDLHLWASETEDVVGKSWKIQCSRAITLNLEWIWTKQVNCCFAERQMAEWLSRLAN
jgi:hypothetical protein